MMVRPHVSALLSLVLGVGTISCIPETSPDAHATHLQFVTQPTSVRSAEPLGTVSVALLDANNDVVTSSQGNVEVSLVGGDTAATLLHTTTVAAVNGIAKFTTLAVDKAATDYRLVAKATGLDSALSALFTIRAGIGGALTFEVPLATTQIAGAPIGGVVVRVTDLAGNLDASASASITLNLYEPPTWESPAPLLGTKTRTAVGGVARFEDLNIQKARDDYMLIASAEGLRPDTSNAFIVLPAAINTLLFIGLTAASAGQPVTSTVLMSDEFGNWPDNTELAPQVPVTLSIGDNPTGAALNGRITELTFRARARFDSVYVSKPGGLYTLIATSPGYKTAVSATFSVTP